MLLPWRFFLNGVGQRSCTYPNCGSPVFPCKPVRDARSAEWVDERCVTNGGNAGAGLVLGRFR